MKVRLKLAPAQLSRLRHKEPEQQSKYLAYLEDQHVMRARQEYKQAKELDPSTTNFFEDWFREWNKVNQKPMRPKKERFVNDHLMSMKWEDE